MVPKNDLYQTFRTSINYYKRSFKFFYDQVRCICCGEDSGCIAHTNSSEKKKKSKFRKIFTKRDLLDWFNRSVQAQTHSLDLATLIDPSSKYNLSLQSEGMCW